jgi:hypothetical protein
MKGTVPGTLYPGAHMVSPLVEDVALFDTRDQIFTTGVAEDGKSAAANMSAKNQLLDAQAKEGLTLGLAITVRYRLYAKRRIISREACRVRWKKKSYRRQWRVCGGRSFQTIRCGRFFRRSARRFFSERRE